MELLPFLLHLFYICVRKCVSVFLLQQIAKEKVEAPQSAYKCIIEVHQLNGFPKDNFLQYFKNSVFFRAVLVNYVMHQCKNEVSSFVIQKIV